jgi:ribonuclease HII
VTPAADRAGRRAQRPSRRHENVWRRRGCSFIAGVDEAGRGCLAGPVFAGAVILGNRVPRGIDDSKKLSPQRREALFGALTQSDAHLAWGVAQPEEIDRLNIRQASFLAMRRALAALDRSPDAILVDGWVIPQCDLQQQAIIHGDALSLAIAAASIVAKVIRDRAMVDLARRHPAYGFERHKGYPTPEHLEALRRHGPCTIHRRSFAPVRALLCEVDPIDPIDLPDQPRQLELAVPSRRFSSCTWPTAG